MSIVQNLLIFCCPASLRCFSSIDRASLKSALRPPPSARAESANFRPFYAKRADFSPPPPATKKRRKLVKIRPRCPHLATKKRRKVVKIRPCGGWWVGGCVQMGSKLVQNLFKCVQICSHVLKHVQTCSKLVQICSNVFKWV